MRADWEYLYGELLQSTADQKGMIDYLEERIAALEAEAERLRHDAEQWRKHENGVARACEQGMADLARLAALDEEATGV